MILLTTLYLCLAPCCGGVPVAGINLALQQANWIEPDENDVIYVAKTIFGEADGCTQLQKSGVAWCICNRVDSTAYPNTIKEVVTQYKQFHGYRERNTYTEEDYHIAYEILFDWLNGIELRRTLPKRFLYFYSSHKGYNIFTTDYRQGEVWDWSLPYTIK